MKMLLTLVMLAACGISDTTDTQVQNTQNGNCRIDENGDCICPGSPIIFDLDGDGYDLTNVDNGVHFDLTGNGIKRRWSWTSVGSDDSWLVIDLNANHIIDDGTEMFGDSLGDPNGFIALQPYDTADLGGNANGKIDRQDGIFGQLQLWRDVNHDGVSQQDELTRIFQSPVAEIDLTFERSALVDQHGNEFRFRAPVKGLTTAWVYDVWLYSKPIPSLGPRGPVAQAHTDVNGDGQITKTVATMKIWSISGRTHPPCDRPFVPCWNGRGVPFYHPIFGTDTEIIFGVAVAYEDDPRVGSTETLARQDASIICADSVYVSDAFGTCGPPMCGPQWDLQLHSLVTTNTPVRDNPGGGGGGGGGCR